MKKFLVFSIFTFFFAFIGISFIGKMSYIKKDINIFSRITDKEIFVGNDKININGINISSTKPGSFPGDFKANKEDYIRWFNYINELNLNCLRVQGLMNPEFYEALYEFNLNNNKPLYLLQGISLNEVALEDGEDIQGEKVSDEFKKNIKTTIDAIHGNKIPTLSSNSKKIYETNISKYVIGYTIGNELAYDDIIYSEIMNDLKDFKGKYVQAKDNASDTEKYLSYIADYLVEYESKNYKEQRIINFVSVEDDIMKFLRDGYVNKKNKEKRFIDIENIKKTEDFKSGIFVSYNVSIAKDESLINKNILYKYFTELNKYHSVPVVISEYSVPSARMAGDFIKNDEKGYITEKEQGNMLIEAYNAIKESGCAGGILFEWQDSWYRSSWNTKELFTLDKSAYWSNAQVFSQNFGLLSFEPGDEKKVSYPDESINEWEENNLIGSNDELTLSMKEDEKYLYFLVEFNKPIDEGDRIYIDLDVTPNSGVNRYEEKKLTFENNVDFIIDLGKENSRVLVHEYYDTFKFIESRSELKVDPNKINVEKNGQGFSVVKLYYKEKSYSEVTNTFKDSKSYETGKLVLGNGNPKSEEFNSVADYYINDNYIELRIPWGLLNFKDPSTKSIIDNFYETFSFDSKKIDYINVGVTRKNTNEEGSRLASKKFKLDSWVKPKYHERLKESYYMLKEEFNKK
ncbi:hypothetical protein [Clostridium perfringens]|uniref:hypothetical protein n=2 Tax=Clostridium perfringens TaxID=1502 RepID=UPI001899134C|nr:hypothetical protein [Clostridium perfringens]MBO3328125.1 hypothetical protein [Clostridium perfringens]HAT4161619.1 hypothetical protein [Clostridium perfringens]